MSILKYTIIGGDLRSIKLANLIASEGKSVNIYGFKKAGFELGIDESCNLDTAIRGSDVIIGPLPCSCDDETVNTPFHPDRIYINDLFKKMTKNQLFIAGRISEKILELSRACNVYCIDILTREEMAVLNAIPTAEGAIQIAMEEMPITLHDSNALILGFGKIGKTLSRMLSGIGANVFVEARKYEDLAWINSYGYRDVHINKLENNLKDMDVVFNTIPHIVLNEKMLKKIGKDCLLIDLASKPGGVDFEKARELGLKAIWALSLPGKVAPVTAAKIIKATVNNITGELGV